MTTTTEKLTDGTIITTSADPITRFGGGITVTTMRPGEEPVTVSWMY